MKRKVKKYDDGGKVYDKEDEGLLGGKIKYREDSEGRKFVAGPSNPYDRNPEERRYYSAGDIKNKLSGLFGGKKEEAAPKEEAPKEGTNRFTAAAENRPTGKLYVNQEYKEEEEKPAKKAAPTPAVKKSKIEAAAPAPQKAKASTDSGIPKDTKSTRMPSGYEKLDVSEKKSMGKDATPMKEEAPKKETKKYGIGPYGVFAGIHKAFSSDDTEEKPAKKSFERKLNTKPTADQMKKMAKGGSVRSASSRADGCAIRGKTRA